MPLNPTSQPLVISAMTKTTLDPVEKIKAAYTHEVLGVDQHVIAAWFGINAARVNEAIQDVRKAVGMSSTNKRKPAE